MNIAATWETAESADIDKDARYLVMTNSAEWRDCDLMIRPGFAITAMLKPNIVRGRPVRIAKINRPNDI